MKMTSGHLIKALAVYSVCVVTAIAFLILTSDETDVHQKAIIKMALGLILCWIVIGGTLMVRFSSWIVRLREGLGFVGGVWPGVGPWSCLASGRRALAVVAVEGGRFAVSQGGGT